MIDQNSNVERAIYEQKLINVLRNYYCRRDRQMIDTVKKNIRDMRGDELIDELSSYKRVLERIEKQKEDIQKIDAKIEKLKRDIEDKKHQGEGGFLMLFTLIIAPAVCSFVLLFSVLALKKDFLGSFGVSLLITFVIGAFGVSFEHANNSHEPDPEIEREIEQYKNEILALQKEHESKEKELKDYYSSDDFLAIKKRMSMMGEEYLNIRTLNSLIGFIRSARANTLEKAIETFETERYRQKLLDNEKEKLEKIRRIADNTKLQGDVLSDIAELERNHIAIDIVNASNSENINRKLK